MTAFLLKNFFKGQCPAKKKCPAKKSGLPSRWAGAASSETASSGEVRPLWCRKLRRPPRRDIGRSGMAVAVSAIVAAAGARIGRSGGDYCRVGYCGVSRRNVGACWRGVGSARARRKKKRPPHKSEAAQKKIRADANAKAMRARRALPSRRPSSSFPPRPRAPPCGRIL